MNLLYIIGNVTESGFETLPFTVLSANKKQNNARKKTAGWKEFVEPFQDGDDTVNYS